MIGDDMGPSEERRVDENTKRDIPYSRVSRERILDASLELFAECGFDGTSIRWISEAAGVPPSLIYYYFESKQGLLKALVEERPLLPGLRAALEPAFTKDPVSALTGIGQRLYETVKRDERMVRILLGELLLSRDVAAGLRAVSEEGSRLVAFRVRGEIAAGRLRSVDAEVLSRLFLSNVMFAAVFKEPENPKHFFEETVSILLCGLISERQDAENGLGEAG